jgi:hypothetical protein
MILSQLAGGDLRALARELDVPVLSGLQHQGDLSVIPAEMADDYTPPQGLVPVAGVAVIGDKPDGGNIHLLLADGQVLFDPLPVYGSRITAGCLHVLPGAEAYLDHPEHGNSGIAPGRYVLRRKRAMGREIEIVSD